MTSFRNAPRVDAQPTTPNKGEGKSKETKTLLATLRMTTAVGAVSLTLAGWGLLAHAATVASAQDVQAATQSFSGSPAALLAVAALPTAAPTDTAAAPTASPTSRPIASRSVLGVSSGVKQATLPAPAPSPTAVPVAAIDPTATPAKLFTLNVVQWVKTQAGDPVAVVQDRSGVLWYVWGPDVPRIEQGLAPQYPPQAVNAVGRSRAS